MINTKPVFVHYRTGGEYVVEEIATNVHDGSKMVVYRSLKDGRWFVRNHEEFFGMVEHEGKNVKRFARWEGSVSWDREPNPLGDIERELDRIRSNGGEL